MDGAFTMLDPCSADNEGVCNTDDLNYSQRNDIHTFPKIIPGTVVGAFPGHCEHKATSEDPCSADNEGVCNTDDLNYSQRNDIHTFPKIIPGTVVGAFPGHCEHKATSEGVNASWEPSDVDASNGNVTALTYSQVNDSYVPDPHEMLMSLYANTYRDDPETLHAIITQNLKTEIVANPSERQSHQTQRQNPSQCQSHEPQPQIHQLFDQSQPAQDVVHTKPGLQLMNHQGTPHPYVGQHVAMEGMACVSATENRAMSPEEATFMKRNNRWRSVGFRIVNLRAIGYTPYQRMVYNTATSITRLMCTETTLEHNPKDAKPIANPCAGLTKQCNLWVRSNSTAPVVGVIREDYGNQRMNMTMGVESIVSRHSSLSLPCTIIHNKRISSSTLSCRTEPQMYQAVDLAVPPHNGFKHVELIVNEFPVDQTDSAALLMVKSKEIFNLGAVSTIPNVSSLLVHRIFSAADVLEYILDLHTSLQVHPFVPRTFTLQIAKTPFSNMSAVGMFVGEAAGEWNLGHAYGMNTITETENVTLAYHVMQCLLRAQILYLRVLGYTMKCIQPARIWRWGTGFRVDYIGCITDILYDLKFRDPVWGEREGLATIRRTMLQLELLDYLPIQVQSTLQSAVGPGAGGSTFSLYDVYNLCEFTEQETSADSDLETILGTGQYRHLSLNVVGPNRVRPYGPFILQTHNQLYRWNKAIIVEPVLHIPATLPCWLPAKGRASIVYRKTGKKRRLPVKCDMQRLRFQIVDMK